MFSTQSKYKYSALHEERTIASTLTSFAIKYRPILIISATAFSAFYLLPLSLHILIDVHVPGAEILTIYKYVYPFSAVLFLLFLIYAGRRLLDDNKKRAVYRQHQRQYETIVDGTYRCVLPQELTRGGGVGDMVVFSAKISKNSESDKQLRPDAVVAVDDDAVTFRMSSSPSDFQDLRGDAEGLRSRANDRNERIIALVSRCIAHNHGNVARGKTLATSNYSVRVLKGGPSGIAVAVVSSQFGGGLAYQVGEALERLRVGNHFAPPTSAPPTMKSTKSN